MTDFADEASERTEAQIEQALASRKPEGPKATGYCLECGAVAPLHTVYISGHELVDGEMVPFERRPIEIPARWCNAECRDDWERRQG